MRRVLSSQFHFILIAIGVFLRLTSYFQNHSLWPDEAWVAVDVAGRSFSRILFGEPILSQSIPPLGFLILEKTAVTFLGNHEYALRFFSLAASLLSLFLVDQLLRKRFSPKHAVIVLALFSLTGPLVYYSAQVKHYAFDVLAAVLLYRGYDDLAVKGFDERSCRRFGIIGALLLWISYASAFVFVSIGIVSLAGNFFKRDYGMIVRLMKSSSYWVLSFIVLAKTALIPMVSDKELLGMFHGSFAPLPFSFTGFLWWIKERMLGMLVDPGGLNAPSVWLFVFVIGCAVSYKKNKAACLRLLLPLFLVLLAATFRKYPFIDRQLLFLTFGIFIMIAEGLTAVSGLFGKYRRVALTLLLIGLLFYPVREARNNVIRRTVITQDREVMKHLKSHYRKGDFIYFNNSAQYAYWYYVGQMKIDGIYAGRTGEMNEGAIGRMNKHAAGKIFDQLGHYDGINYIGIQYQEHIYNDRGHFQNAVFSQDPNDIQLFYPGMKQEISGRDRVWLLLSYIEPEVEEFILKCFMGQGQLLDQLEREGSSLFLFNMSPPEKS